MIHRPPMVALPADHLTPGRIVWLCGCRFVVRGIAHDPIGNGTAAAPRPRIVAALEWSGEGRDPGPAYRVMTAGRGLDHCWTVEANTGRPTIH